VFIPRSSLQFSSTIKYNDILFTSICGHQTSSSSLFQPRRRCSHTTTTSWAIPPQQFQIGDAVLISDVDGTNNQLCGKVQDKRGGWYTIRLDKDSSVVKRRGGQMELFQSLDHADATDMAGMSGGGGKMKTEEDVEPPSSSLPQPTIIDLDSILQSNNIIHDNITSSTTTDTATTTTTISQETIDQLAHCHSHYTKWIIFSDLHVMPTTLSTCLDVLNTIHTKAIERNAGILFLGDFWHHRGFVRVDCLNSVLDTMSHWKVPCIMIPGNHDQIDWRGVEHALTPLNNAYRIHDVVSSAVERTTATEVGDKQQEQQQQYSHAGPLILSHPTKFLDAFFIPHIRDKSMMKSILSSEAVTQSSALFVHADVKGASMNDLIKSQHGLSTTFFPNEKHIYSGHFHKPHVVTTNKEGSASKIRYVGSPYQISSSEEGQSKSLLVVDSQQGWECIEEIPLDIGPRFHRVTSVDEFLRMSEVNDEEDNSVHNSSKVRAGDKIIVAVPQQEIDVLNERDGNDAADDSTVAALETNPFNARVKACRKAGISVEIRDSQAATTTLRTDENHNDFDVDLEELSPSATLATYLENEVTSGNIGEDTAKELVEKGEAILRELNDMAMKSTAPMNDAPKTIRLTDIDFESVSIRGFGLFRKESTYPLHKRGVVLIRGRNDDFGSDSNGVGKTTIAMASLWALSGSVDPRPAQDMKVGDVVNDLSKVAEVTLRGFLNSKPFIVKRTKGKSAAGQLSFILDGNDLTRQSATDTQKLINEHFCTESPQLLMRTIFHGQHSIGGLLEASDAKLKDELSQLVSLDIWQQSASLARSKQREYLRRATELEGMISLREKDEKDLLEKCSLVKSEMESRRAVLERARVLCLEHEQRVLSTSLNSTMIDEEMDTLQLLMSQSDAELHDLEEEMSTMMVAHNDEIARLRSVLSSKVTLESEAKVNLSSEQRIFDRALIQLETAESNLLQIQSEWENSALPQDESQEAVCHTCGQPLASLDAKDLVAHRFEEKLNLALSTKDEAETMMSNVTITRDQAQDAVDAASLKVNTCLEEVSQAERTASLDTNDIRKRIQEIRSIQLERSANFASLVKQTKVLANFDLEKTRNEADLARLGEAFDASSLAYESCCDDLNRVQENITDLKKQRDERSREAASTATLVNVLGAKGIQAFVLQNIVDGLEICSQPYLDELSEGSLQLSIKVGSNDSIIKNAAIRNPDGSWCNRPLASLSGGQWRRLSLSLSLGFVHLASKRGNLRSSLLVMDEPLTHLDSTGRAKVGKLLRKICSETSLGLSTILVILQDIAADEIDESFDQVDEVVKSGGESCIIIDENIL
jgi:DNA repair exonuclease SbcCD ATPase subunit/DNA repair exonuclease SbcCD nuclease subunit